MIADNFNTTQFARIAGLTPRRIYQLQAEGLGPPYLERRIGLQTERLIAFSDALDWLRDHRPHRYVGYVEMMNLLVLPDRVERIEE